MLADVADLDEDIVSREDEIQEGSDYCPACHSKNVEIKTIRHAKSVFWAIDLWKRSFGSRKALRCRACGNKWLR